MTQIHLYQCQTAPPARRWIAQFERLKDNLYVTIHGSSAETAQAKAELMRQFQVLDPKERTAFNLKGRLAALNDGVADIEEDDLL